jgi:catalase
MDDPDRDHLGGNIVAHASDHVTTEVQLRVVEYWSNVAPELGARVAAGLGLGEAARARVDALRVLAGGER